MAKLAGLPRLERAPRAEKDIRIPRLRTRFYAFLSYSHKDNELAAWLHHELEKFRVPHALTGKLTANGVVPRRLSPVFRDQQDLSAGGELADEIKAGLAASQFLVVLCSPTAAKSRWTNQEIESFKRTRPEGCVLAAIVAGEPFASDMPGREDEECFPPALRYKYDRRGHRTGKRAEPLAADFRDGAEGKRTAFLKLVAGMLGVGLDELVHREQTRRQRRLAYVAAASIAGMAVTSMLAVAAWQARNEAREQRREAEGLVAFMVGDLKDKLEPIGRLDALDGVGSRVLAYYSKQDASELTNAALSQRSRALSLMAQVATARADFDTALRLYREAMAGTAEAITRNPNNPEAIFEHAQNVFYVGQIAQIRGDFRTAEASMREYKQLASRMVALAPDSLKYRMEVQYADTNLGVVLTDQRRFAEAVAQFSEALRTIDAIATADSQNAEYRESVAESLAWLADANRLIGAYGPAIAERQRDIATLDELLARTGAVTYQQRLIPAHRMLGVLYAETGQSALAERQLRAAVDEAGLLVPKEPTNKLWLEYSFKARFDLAWQLLRSGKRAEAASQTNAGCATVNGLLGRKAVKPEWRIGAMHCSDLRARLALIAGADARALAEAQQALRFSQSVHSGDPTSDAYLIAGAYRLVGDIEKKFGQLGAAHSAWSSALASIPTDPTEIPREMAEHAAILERLGRAAEAQQLSQRLAAMGCRLADLEGT